MKNDSGQPLKGPHKLESLRGNMMQQMSVLLENQTRTHSFSETINGLIQQSHADMLSELETTSCLDEASHQSIENAKDACKRLDKSLDFLLNEHRRQWQNNTEYLRNISKEFGQTVNYLSNTLIERDLFEQQSQMLEHIVLSHEKISNWKEFIQEILLKFHAIFSCPIFMIAFEKEQRLQLHVYYLGHHDATIKASVQQKWIPDWLKQLNLAKDMTVDIENHEIEGTATPIEIEAIQLITTATPKTEGLPSIAYVSGKPLAHPEHDIVRSLLSVMAMIMGSSKQLSHTLEKLEYHSGHDALTGLYNRRFFTDILDYEIGRAGRHQHEFCILLLDLDNFKDINDSYGHPTGDDTLVLIAETLRSNVRKGDIATRIGGDEFAIILTETSQQNAEKVAESIRQALHSIGFKTATDRSYRVTASIGLACFPKDGQTPDDLMANADAALYHAKNLGKNGISTLDAARQQAKLGRGMRIYAEEIRNALKENRVFPYYQPIIHCKSGEVFANETLARMKKTDGNIVTAASFIEIVEKYGLARELDKVILTQALTASRQQMIETGRSARVFVNLAPQEIQERGILSFAETLCCELSLPPSCVVFEILERDAIVDISSMNKFLRKLRNKGFSFALDDFGSGYNSFHYLRKLHFDYVKIDGDFVRNILSSRVDKALVRNLSHLCKELGIMTVAKCVESDNILEVLQEIGIDYAQGYAIAKPASKPCFNPYTRIDIDQWKASRYSNAVNHPLNIPKRRVIPLAAANY